MTLTSYYEADSTDEDAIVAFDETMHRGWICDVAAVGAGYGHLRREAIREFLTRAESMVIVAEQDGEIVGYIVADKFRGDGCRGRWMGVWPQPGVDVNAVIQGMFDVLCERYGWIQGRLTNPVLHAAAISFGSVPKADDPTLLTYRRS